MADNVESREWLAEQYKDSGNIASRLDLHARYSTNPYCLGRWIFDRLELADDAIRSLEQLWGIPIDGHRIAVTREQIEEMDLLDDFNPAKTESSRSNKASTKSTHPTRSSR